MPGALTWDPKAQSELTTREQRISGASGFSAPTPTGEVDPTGSPVSGYGLRTTPVRIGTIGDSAANTNGTATDVSVFAASASVSPEKYQLHCVYPQAYLVANGGVSGETTTQILARDTASASATRKSIQDVLDMRPDVVLLRGGSVNNITGATPLSNVATCYAEHCTIINRILSAGIPVIDCGIYGANAGTPSNLTGTRTALMQLEAMYDAYAAQFPGRVFRPQWTGILRDSTGAYLPNVCLADGQGLHLSFYGQYLAAQQEAAILTQLFGVSSGWRYRGKNMLLNAATVARGSNALFANTGTSGIGTTPTGFTFGTAGAGGTRAHGVIETIDGRRWATMEFTPTATGGINCYLPLDAANWTTASGDIWGLELDFFFKPLSGSSIPVSGLNAQFNYNDGSARAITSLAISQAFTWPDAAGWMGHVVMQPAQLGGANTVPEAFVQISVADTTPIKIGVSNPRLVKLGTTSNWPPALP